jgi:hypothetical protein
MASFFDRQSTVPKTTAVVLRSTITTRSVVFRPALTSQITRVTRGIVGLASKPTIRSATFPDASVVNWACLEKKDTNSGGFGVV